MRARRTRRRAATRSRALANDRWVAIDPLSTEALRWADDDGPAPTAGAPAAPPVGPPFPAVTSGAAVPAGPDAEPTARSGSAPWGPPVGPPFPAASSGTTAPATSDAPPGPRHAARRSGAAPGLVGRRRELVVLAAVGVLVLVVGGGRGVRWRRRRCG